MKFSGKNGQNNRGWQPLVREILDPPLITTFELSLTEAAKGRASEYPSFEIQSDVKEFLKSTFIRRRL